MKFYTKAYALCKRSKDPIFLKTFCVINNSTPLALITNLEQRKIFYITSLFLIAMNYSRMGPDFTKSSR